MVNIIKTKLLVPGCKKGPAGDNFHVRPVAAADDLTDGLLLHGHGADEDVVGPAEV